MRVLVVIVNYRSARLVVDCLDSLAGEWQSDRSLRVVVVENDSQDDSAEVLRTAIDERGFGEWAELRVMPRNGGFAYGVNAGVQPALAGEDPPDAFLLLNPDTYVRPGAIRALTDGLISDPDVGMVGSRVEDPDGTPQHSRFRFPNIGNELDTGLRLGIVHRLLGDRVTCPPIVDEPHDIDWLSGASMLVRREVFEQVGPFDEGYFLYFEELDFFRRANALGIRSRYAPASRVVHLVGQSTGVTVRDRRPGRTPSYWFESRRRYYGKHHSWLYKVVADAAFMSGRMGHHVIRTLRLRKDTGPPWFLWDFFRHNWLPGRRPQA